MPRELHFGGLHTGASQRVFLASPVSERYEPEFVLSLLASQVALAEAKIDYDVHILAGDCHVDDARNLLVRNFLETDCTDLVFLDADVNWNAVDLVRLLRFDAPVVAGAYPRKSDEDQGFPVRFFDRPHMTNLQGLIEVAGAPTGFMRIRREVLETLYGLDTRLHKGSKDGEERKPIAIIFERLYDKKVGRLSGDYAFCEKAHAVGFSVFVDPSMSFAHIGTNIWTGTLGRYLCEKENLLTPRFCAAFRRVQAGMAKPDDFRTLYLEWNNAFALPAKFCEAVLDAARQTGGPILEFGAGLTTLLFGTLGQPVEALEHDLAWVERIQAAVTQLKLSNVTITYSPLKPMRDGAWYSTAPQVTPDFVFCDGPQQKWKRENLFEAYRIPDHAVFVADDMVTSPAWRRAIEQWAVASGRSFTLIGEDTRQLAVVTGRQVQAEAAE